MTWVYVTIIWGDREQKRRLSAVLRWSGQPKEHGSVLLYPFLVPLLTTPVELSQFPPGLGLGLPNGPERRHGWL